MTLVKICGITNLVDALASAEAGADVLGFNFYQKSPRYVAPAAAARIGEQLPEQILRVGIFVNEASPARVADLARAAKVTAVQLHGDETAEYCRALRDEFMVIKAMRVGRDFSPAQAETFDADAVLLDAFSTDAYGGTGRTFDWSMASEVRALVPRLFLSGGLAPENVAEAIAQVGPYAVDACSHLESAPGQKDLERVRAFVAAVRRADRIKGESS
jgi:phosphoribosylanthranilate isomerase